MLFNLISLNKQLTLVRILGLAFVAFYGFVVVCLTDFFKMRYFNSALAIDKGSPKQKGQQNLQDGSAGRGACGQAKQPVLGHQHLQSRRRK